MVDGIASADRVRRTLQLTAVAVCVFSIPVFCTRFLNDMDYYALVSDKLIRGAVLYRDAIDTKPPMVFLHYAAIFRLFGTNNMTAVKIVTMVWLALSAAVTWRIFKRLFPATPGSERAALLFVVASFSGWGEDFLSSNTEILSNLFVLAGVWCLVVAPTAARRARLVLAGLLFGMAFLYRYQAAAALAADIGALALAGTRASQIARRLLWLGLGFVIAPAVFVADYARIGALGDLALLLRYQSFYMRPHELYRPLAFGRGAVVVISQAGFLLLAGSEVAAMIRRGLRRYQDWFPVLFLLFSIVPFFLGGHFFPHYFVQALPPLVLVTTARLSSGSGSPTFVRRARALIAVNVAVFTVLNCAYYALRPTERRSPAAARFVRAQSSPDDGVLVWTWRSHLLFEADRVYATRFLSNEFLIGRLYGTAQRLDTATAESARPLAVAELWPVFLNDLQTGKPRIIVDDAPGGSNFTIDRYPPLAAFVAEHYDPPQLLDGLAVYVRKRG
jgi:hypothetical protein